MFSMKGFSGVKMRAKSRKLSAQDAKEKCMKPSIMCRIIDRKRYDTDKSDVVCGNDWWDGHNYERHGTNQFLFRTKKGNYFFQVLTQWQGSCDELIPCSVDEAMEFYRICSSHHEERMTFEEAFPNVVIEEA
jgi:hypothetical protein